MDGWPEQYEVAARVASLRIPESRLPPHLERADLFQAAAVRLVRARPDPSTEALVQIIAHRGVIDLVRSQGGVGQNGSRAEIRVDSVEDLLIPMASDARFSVPSHEDDVVNQLHRDGALVALRETIRGTFIPPRQRRVLDLHLQGLTDRQVGQSLGISVNTVSGQLAHARRRLRQAALEGRKNHGRES